ncbi:hypothetical protein Dip510_001241 [Elusimicrobium posterum]|uniref:hypothetical protein n=1 Tax=Elusimicrobium posterum TaxID=3116653 RepID=UPI003C7823F7
MKRPRQKYINFFVCAVIVMAGALAYHYKNTPRFPKIDYDAVEEFEQVDINSVGYEQETYEAPESGAGLVPEFGFSGVAERELDLFEQLAENDKNRNSRPVSISTSLDNAVIDMEVPFAETEEGKKYLETSTGVVPEESEDDVYTSKIAMITAPVKTRTIKTTAEYNAFKKEAQGSYPAINFNKDQLFVLESDTNLPHNIFDIVDLKKEGDKNIIEYRVMILGLKFRSHSHTFKVIPKNIKNIEIRQVL